MEEALSSVCVHERSHACAPMPARVQTSVLVVAQQDARAEEGESEAAVAMVTVRLA